MGAELKELTIVEKMLRVSKKVVTRSYIIFCISDQNSQPSFCRTNMLSLYVRNKYFISKFGTLYSRKKGQEKDVSSVELTLMCS